MKNLLLLTALSFSTASWAGVTFPMGKWDTSEVSVCFAAKKHAKHSRMKTDLRETFMQKPKLTSFTTKEKAAIRAIIEQEYTIEKTGISFVGWGDCDKKNPAKVWLHLGKFRENTKSGIATLGQSIVYDGYRSARDRQTGEQVYLIVQHRSETPLKPEAVYLMRPDPNPKASKVDAETQLKAFALHEFGHIAGLLHEHERWEMNQDNNCSLAYQTRPIDRTESVQFTSVYDYGSIMNYCYLKSLLNESGMHYRISRRGLPSEDNVPMLVWPGLLPHVDDRIVEKKQRSDSTEYRIRLGLSEGDRHALRCLYGKEDAAKCRPDFKLTGPL